ncbi:uncharacterized protein LOC120636668 isoform X2 [Pararge aegeria]|uniref:uncharacterized protein LOC120636668 isoform X2 n=1 Tax=Pararge aegeria TaxID=116150 RepID=UPI0019D126BE|nr:uncharacterized protein LOC120636668 isoform X2 [Pararge aegeria]
MGKKLLICAGVTTLLQAVTQVVLSVLSIAQYLGFIDFLRELPHLIFIKILYYHTGGTLNEYSRPIRWPWVAVTVAVCAVDLVATVIFANDSFHTRTLNNIMNYIGGTANGVGGISIDTSATAWIMVIIYSRFIIIFIVNVVVIILVALNKNKSKKADLNLVESPNIAIPAVQQPRHSTPLAKENNNLNIGEIQNLSDIIEDANNDSSFDSSTENLNESYYKTYGFNMPRARFSRTFQNIKKKIFAKDTFVQSKDKVIDRYETIEHSSERSPQMRGSNRRAVIFPENLLSLPQRVENMIAAVQHRLDRSVKDPSGPISAPQSLPAKAQMSDANITFNKGRRDTAPELSGQLPWTYIPEAPYRLYWDLPSDEEPPPIPLADYTAIGVASGRKTSVHRAPPMPKMTMKTLKKHQKTRLPQNSKMTLKEVDVLF